MKNTDNWKLIDGAEKDYAHVKISPDGKYLLISEFSHTGGLSITYRLERLNGKTRKKTK